MGWGNEQVASYVITLSGGPAWVTGKDDQTIFFTPTYINTYTVNNNDNTLGALELFAGWNSASSSSFQGQLGLAIAGTSQATIEGGVWQNVTPALKSFNYSYKVRHMHIAAKAKLLGDFGYTFYPYLSGSLGYGYNRATDFSLSYQQFTVPAVYVFTNSSTSAFTYTAGAGIEVELATNWRIGVGYEFADWGKIELGRAPGQISGSTLGLNHFYTQQFQVSLSYLC